MGVSARRVRPFLSLLIRLYRCKIPLLFFVLSPWCPVFPDVSPAQGAKRHGDAVAAPFFASRKPPGNAPRRRESRSLRGPSWVWQVFASGMAPARFGSERLPAGSWLSSSYYVTSNHISVTLRFDYGFNFLRCPLSSGRG